VSIAYLLIATAFLSFGGFWLFLKNRNSRKSPLSAKKRSDFVANVSHEMRTPLTSIQGYAELLQQDLNENKIDSAKESAEAISRNTQRLLDICSDLLVLSKYENSPEILTRKFVTGAEIMSEVLAVLKQRHQEKGHDILITGAEELIFSHKSQLIQVLINLTDNAIRYLPNKGQIKIAFSKYTTLKADRDSRYIYANKNSLRVGLRGSLVSVVDNGPGISRNHLERLFERFYRVDKGRSRETGGTGLGLAIVKHILELHGGWVRVASDVGQGARFDCFLPDPLTSELF
jgi:two-component system phosphate regulon sensor histidine kinase PhoR